MGNDSYKQAQKELADSRKAYTDAQKDVVKSNKKTREQINEAEKAKQQKDDTTVSASSEQREVPCPFCGGHVKKRDVSGGRTELVIPFTNPKWRIPIPPFIAKILKPDPKQCSCEGEQKIKDVSDDSAKYQQVQQAAQANIEKSIELEAKMGTGGNRTTYIEKSDTLMVGLGFNRNDSYEKIPKGHRVPGSIVPDAKTGAAFPRGFEGDAVVGKQTSPGWPSAVGNYKIVCANSFNVVAGAGGISLNTKGPLTFNSGILNLTGPQVNVGSSSGPLTLEGDTVSITGKTIAITPTDGKAGLYVKGSIHTPANIIVGGQLHAETLSFCKASCPSKDTSSSNAPANPDTTQTFQAAWGGVAVKGITSSVLDLQTYFGNVVSDSETAAVSLLSPTQMLNLVNRMGTLAKMCIPVEQIVTGFAWLGPIPLPVTNFPHIQGLPSMNHSHSVRVPDIECKDYSSPQALRAAVINESLTSNTPVVKKTALQDLAKYLLAIPGFIANTGLVAQRAIRWIVQVFS
jgi:hypothetical protein